MVYPAALAAVSVIVVVCLMIFVVPPLVEQFSTLNVRLPWLTRVLIGLSEGLVAFWPALLVGVMAVTLAGRLALRQSGPRLAFDRAVLRAPVIGRRAASLNASRFIRSVSTLTASGLPVLDSVRAAKGSTSNRHFAAEIDDIAISIERGESLSTAMRRSRALPGIAIYMAASGESSGELSLMLEKAADYLDQETESTLQMLLSLLEPAVIIVMGLVVAGIVMAIMLPILQLNQLAIA
jgi:general secretion pathway protein F